MKDDESHPKFPKNPKSQLHQPPITPHPSPIFLSHDTTSLRLFPFSQETQKPTNTNKTKQKKLVSLFLCFSFLSFSLSFLPCLFPRITQIPSRKKLGFFPAKRKQWYPPKTTRIGSSITT